MKINWKVRIKNKVFWLAIIPAMLLLIKVVAAFFGVQLDIVDINAKLKDIVEATFLVLALLGIVNDPTTNGVSDSDRAMSYDKPN